MVNAKKISMVMATASLLAIGCSVGAAETDSWKLELTPYLWAAGIDADVTVRGKEFNVDQNFSDLIEHVDAAAALLVVAEKNRWQVYAQGDYMSLSADGNKGGVDGKIESDIGILTGGLGYVFDGFNEKSQIAVLLGCRYTHMNNEVTLMGKSSGERSNDIVDGLVILRPRYNFTDTFRFSPTLNVGAGDSDLTYELQPEFQYDISDAMSLRFGYRRVHYKEEFDSGNEFDGSMNGFLVGLGVTL